MAERTLTLPGQKGVVATPEIREQTYWQAVGGKLIRDKITMVAVFIGLFMVVITLAAPWIGDNILGFDPNDANLRIRNDPPTWAEASWPVFQDFSRSCQGDNACAWTLWPQILSLSATGLRDCWSAGPGNCHWMGTDDAGRDVMTRGVYGGRVSLRIGLYVTVISMTLGIMMGLLSGYYAATLIDDVINAIIETIGSIPLLFFLIILASIFTWTRSPEGLAFLIGIFGWMGVSRLLRGQLFSIRERDYILASRAMGASTWRIMFRHMLPNVSSLIIVVAVFDIVGGHYRRGRIEFPRGWHSASHRQLVAA